MNVSCQCGAITFRTPLAQPVALYFCHCSQCRRLSGSAFGCSAMFPRFALPADLLRSGAIAKWTRPTNSGTVMHCYFCSTCGSRLVHEREGKNLVSVRGGAILVDDAGPQKGLDWSSAVHIWAKDAVVPIPEGVRRIEEEPVDE